MPGAGDNGTWRAGVDASMGMQSFRRLVVWNKAMTLAKRIYAATAQGPVSRDWGLRDQLRRSAVSIPSNIAEGNERGSDAEACRFFFIAKGSAGELATQLEIARDVGAIPSELTDELSVSCEELSRILNKLIDVRSGRAPSRASRLVPRAPADG